MNNEQIVMILLVIIGIFIFIQYTFKPEALGNTAGATKVPLNIATTAAPVKIAAPVNAAVPAAYSCKNPESDISKIVSGSNQLTAEDLLPKYDSASDFAKENPVDNLLKEQNFLVSGYHMGINTVMQSNKIPYHDLRSAPQVPKQQVGPWSQSSYEEGAGFNRRYFELGA